MRTILILLILICSLTQFESVQAAKRRIKLPECKGDWEHINYEERMRAHSEHNFYCYAPEICTDRTLEGWSHTEGGVARVTNETDITDDCPAIIRILAYDESLVQVWLESFEDIQKNISIEFIMSEEDRKPEQNIHRGEVPIRNRFSCQLEDGKIIGRYGKDRVVGYLEDVLPNKLTCTFHLKWPRGIHKNQKKTYGALFSDEEEEEKIFSFLIGDTETKYERLSNFQSNYAKICNPRNMDFNIIHETHPEKLYEKVQYNSGKIYCNDFYELEVRKILYNKQFDFTYMSEFETKNNGSCHARFGFSFDGEQYSGGSSTDVRCAADAKYFCDYDVKAKRGKRMPYRVKPNWNPKRESSLKCPPNKPHLVILKERSKKYFPNAKIECRNYGADQFWTVDGEILYEDGPEVYCTDTVKCNRVHKIPASSVENGFLDRKDFLPRCYKNGILYVDDKKVLSKECDSTDGKFKYSVEEGVKLNIDSGTKFICKYP